MPPVGFEPTISEGERPKTYALDRAAQRPAITLSYNANNLKSKKESTKIVVRKMWQSLECGGRRICKHDLETAIRTEKMTDF